MLSHQLTNFTQQNKFKTNTTLLNASLQTNSDDGGYDPLSIYYLVVSLKPNSPLVAVQFYWEGGVVRAKLSLACTVCIQ